MMEDIATWFLKTDIDLFVGGGMRYFNNRKTDQRDLVAELGAHALDQHRRDGRRAGDGDAQAGKISLRQLRSAFPSEYPCYGELFVYPW